MSATEVISEYHFQRLRTLDGAVLDNRLKDLLSASLIRVLINQSEVTEEYQFVSDTVLKHIADWLKAAIINGDAWLSNTDHLGRPKKLMKFGSVEQISAEADKAMLKAAQKLSNTLLVKDDETIEVELGEGFYLVRLLTPAALDRESAAMQHCIGNGAYDKKLSQGAFKYLSLRDNQGKPHATIEIHNDQVVEVQGKQNRQPLPKYISPIKSYIQQQNLSVRNSAQMIGVIIDHEGVWHDFGNLPDRLHVKGNLSFQWTNIAILPKELIVEGNVNISNCNVNRLPETFHVKGNLLLGTRLEYTGSKTHIGGDLKLMGNGVRNLPSNLRVDGNLDMAYNSVEQLPDNLFVGGNLIARSNPLKQLPKGLKVMGNLDLENTAVSHIPEDIYIGGNLLVVDRHLKEVHPNAQISGKVIVELSEGDVYSNGTFEADVMSSSQFKERFKAKSKRTYLDVVFNLFK